MAVRDTVMKSLMAIGSAKEAAFYANIFQEQDPEKFALIVVDPRCLRNPLLEALISDLKILSDLKLTPILLVGANDDQRTPDINRTNVRFQAERLCRELEGAGIRNNKLNCASYEFKQGMLRITRAGRFPILELTEIDCGMNLLSLVQSFEPAKVIFLQPSGGFRVNGKRIPEVNLDQIDDCFKIADLSDGQKSFVKTVRKLAGNTSHHCTYVIASPLNLLAELFTVKGAGTMLRRGAVISSRKTYRGISKAKLKTSIETAFQRPLTPDCLNRKILKLYLEENYRGGAIITELAGLNYLSKFWVGRAAQGEGIARDIWQNLESDMVSFFWRSKKDNPFNNWYMKVCDGMQISGEWRVFWKGLHAQEIPMAIEAAASAPIDFSAQEKQ